MAAQLKKAQTQRRLVKDRKFIVNFGKHPSLPEGMPVWEYRVWDHNREWVDATISKYWKRQLYKRHVLSSREFDELKSILGIKDRRSDLTLHITSDTFFAIVIEKLDRISQSNSGQRQRKIENSFCKPIAELV